MGGAEGAAGEDFKEQGEGEDGERKREAGGGGGGAEESHAPSHRPVEERGFFEIADAVGVESDPVVAEEDLACDLGVHGVCVVEQRWGEEGEGRVEDEPEHEEHEAVRAGLGGGGASGRKHGLRVPRGADASFDDGCEYYGKRGQLE